MMVNDGGGGDGGDGGVNLEEEKSRLFSSG